MSLFPKGFDYYAGGHVHSTFLKEVPKYGFVAFPGPLFGHGFGDMEEIAKGTKRGFFLVDFKEKVEKVSFVQVPLPEVIFEGIDADGKSATYVTKSLEKLAGGMECQDKIVLLKVSGRLSSGRTSEIPFDEIRKGIEKKGAIMVRINRAGLTSTEMSPGRLSGKTKEEIEESMLKEALSSYSVDPAIDPGVRTRVAGKLAGGAGLRTAKKLLGSLEQEAKDNERKEDFRGRMIKEAKEALGMEAD
jgi:exonuclease SbcD